LHNIEIKKFKIIVKKACKRLEGLLLYSHRKDTRQALRKPPDDKENQTMNATKKQIIERMMSNFGNERAKQIMNAMRPNSCNDVYFHLEDDEATRGHIHVVMPSSINDDEATTIAKTISHTVTEIIYGGADYGGEKILAVEFGLAEQFTAIFGAAPDLRDVIVRVQWS
jgi:Mg/Co/Ni transporter MgtE